MTGSATGPHLDYRLKRNGVFVNPVVGALAPGAGRADSRRAARGVPNASRDARLLVAASPRRVLAEAAPTRRSPDAVARAPRRIAQQAPDDPLVPRDKIARMAGIRPFRALRPARESAAAVSSVPYDVVSTDEARQLAAGNPLSFLHVTRSEIDLPPGTDPYSRRGLRQGAARTSRRCAQHGAARRGGRAVALLLPPAHGRPRADRHRRAASRSTSTSRT